jgi:cell division protein FtsL
MCVKIRVVQSWMKAKKSKVNRIVNVAIIALICYVAGSLLVLQADISSYRRQLASLETQCEEQQIRNDEMDSLIQRGSDFDYIVKMAREKLGLIFPEERVFYDAAGNQ